MLEWGMHYTVGKLKSWDFRQAKEHANQIPDYGDTTPESPRTKSREFLGVSQECPGATPHDPRKGGVLQRAAEAYVSRPSP